MAETHELRLKINASAARAGAKEFKGAIASIQQAVAGLEKTSSGAFKDFGPDPRRVEDSARATDGLSRSSKSAGDAVKRMALASAAALRTSQNETATLSKRLNSLGDTAGIDRLNSDLAKLQAALIQAQSPLAVRSARSAFADTAADVRRRAISAETDARATREATQAASAHAAQLDRLRSKYNPLYAASKAYESALEEIATAEREGVLSAQMATEARQRAAQQLMQASAAADQYSGAMMRSANSTQQGIMVGHQLSDVLITSQMGFQSVGMIALQQGSQLASQMNTLKATGGSVFPTLLAGFTSLLNPISLITIGAVAAGAMIAKWFFAAGEETKSFSDALSDANSRISELRSATDALSGGNLRQLREEYGMVNAELDAHLERLRKVAELEAGMANAEMIGGIRDALTSDGNLLTGDIDAIRRAFDTTNDRARTFMQLMRDVENARTFEEQAEAVTRLRQAVESTTGGLDKAEGGARGVLTQLVRAEDAALRLLAAQNGTTDATNNASGAASTLSFTIGTAADEAARLLANLNSVPAALAVMGRSVQGQIASIQAQNRALNLQLSEGLTPAAANRSVQLQDMVSAAADRGQRINFDDLARQAQEIEKLNELGQTQANLRKQLQEANRAPSKARGGGGSRAEELTTEQEAMASLNEELQNRLTGLDEERRVIGLVASGMFQTEEAAGLFAKAQTAMGGTVDAATAGMIFQIDAAQTLNEQLRELARNPAREFADSVGSWVTAGNQIQEGVIGDLRDGIRGLITGEGGIEEFGEAILGTFADVMADRATAELLDLFNLTGPDAPTLGQTLGGMMGERADVVQLQTGSQAAGQTLYTSLVTGGQTVGQSITAALAQGGAQAGSQITVAGTTSAVQMGTQTQTGGTVAAQQMQQGIMQGGAAAAQQMAAASAGGGGGGGFGGGIWGTVIGAGISLLGSALSGGGSDSSEPAEPVTPVGIRQFAEGTPNTSGIPAILHDNEAVIPLSKGRKVPVEMSGKNDRPGARVVNVTQNIQTPDADSFRKSRDQIAADAASLGQRAMAKNN